MNNFKAIVSAVVAALTVLVAEGADVLPTWALLLVASVVAGLSTYLVKPGPGIETPRARR